MNMADPGPPADPEAQAAAAATAAKRRFFALSLFRLSGILLIGFGFLAIRQRFDFVQGDKARVMGAIFAVVGLFQTIVIPRIMLRAWRTPKP